MKLAIIGTGYVGLVTGACLAELGNEVTCVEIDEDKVKKLQSGSIPIHEPGLEEIVERQMAAGRLLFTTSLAAPVAQADAVFICVPTPQGADGRADMTFVESAASDIAHALCGYTVVVNKSTVPVGSAHVVEQLIRRYASPNVEVDVASNPEFLREGSAVYDFLHPDRVVVGTNSERAVGVLTDLYRPLTAPVMVVSPETAELIKYASNAFLATKVSFINAIANICDELGADVKDVALGMGYDPRIGFEFLRPGPGFGGSCFPKDCSALIAAASDRGYDFGLLRGVLEVNEAQKDVIVAKVLKALDDSLEGKRVAVWGLAFKADTDDTRDSPALAIVERLKAVGATLVAYDPAVPDRIFESQGLLRATSALEACRGADVLLVLTEWDEFRWFDLAQLSGVMAKQVIVDARNALDASHARGLGFEYVGVGR